MDEGNAKTPAQTMDLTRDRTKLGMDAEEPPVVAGVLLLSSVWTSGSMELSTLCPLELAGGSGEEVEIDVGMAACRWCSIIDSGGDAMAEPE